jgi:hypothetical protein
MNISFDDITDKAWRVMFTVILLSAAIVFVCFAAFSVTLGYAAIKGDSPQFCERSAHGR